MTSPNGLFWFIVTHTQHFYRLYAEISMICDEDKTDDGMHATSYSGFECAIRHRQCV